MNELLRLVKRQLEEDLRALPATARQLLGDEARVARCRNIAELRALARRRVPRAVFDYVDGAAQDEVTARRNLEDLGRLTLYPRVLVDVAEIDMSTTLLGQRISVPFIGAPTGMTGLSHYRGEAAVARALHGAGTITTLSTVASYSVEELATESPGPTWFQLYVPRDRGLARALLEAARAAGCLALVLTVDLPLAGSRERDLRSGFTVPPRLTLRSLLDGLARPAWSAAFVREQRFVFKNLVGRVPDVDPGEMARLVNRQFDPSVTWSDLEWMRDAWQGPLVVKGILRPDDARTAVELGAAAIVVSNHGGRQLDHAPSSIRALPPVVDAVGDDAEVLMDGGIRRGTDILKALALGARACMVGRALVYGVGAGGDAGARRAVQLLRDELELALALAGCTSLAQVDASLLFEVESPEPWPTT